MLKPLDQRNYPLLIIEDLGMVYPTKNSKYKARRAIFECSICKIGFTSVPTHVKSGVSTRCMSCRNKHLARIKSEKSRNTFVLSAISIYGTRYDYSKVVYINNRTKVEIKCISCNNIFYQTPDGHLIGKNGCPKCNRTGFDPSKPALLYYFRLNGLYKIGITNRTLKKRYLKPIRDNMSEIREWHFNNGQKAFDLEQFIIKKFKAYKYTGKSPFSDLPTTREMFTDDVLSGLSIESIIEEENNENNNRR